MTVPNDVSGQQQRHRTPTSLGQRVRISLPRDWDLRAISLVVAAILLFFMTIPVLLVLYEALYFEGELTFEFVRRFWTVTVYRRSLINSILVATGITITTSLIAVPYAYLINRTDLPFRRFFRYIPLVPFMLPSFLAALGYIFILGRSGTVNLLLQQWLGVKYNFIYHVHGIIFIETTHIFPITYLTVLSGFQSIDPSLEESAKDLGASHLELFRSVTFPLLLPSFLSGAFLTFALGMRLLGVPLIVGFWNLMAPMILQTTTSFNETLIRTGLFGMIILILVSSTIFVFVRNYLSKREYATSKPSGISQEYLRISLQGAWKWLAFGFCSVITFVSVIPFIAVILISLSQRWGHTPLPTEFSLSNWGRLIENSTHFIVNSLKYSGIAVVGNFFLGFILAYIVERADFRGKTLLDIVAMIALFIPGAAIAVGYLRFFAKFNFPFLGVPLTWSWIVLPIGYLFRRLPYALRSSASSIQTVHKSLEEASEDLGASRFRTLREIVYPLSRSGLIAGAIMVFIFTMKDVPITMWLTPGSRAGNLTWAIFDHAGIGGFQESAVFGTILVGVIFGAVLLGIRLIGTGFGELFKVQ